MHHQPGPRSLDDVLLVSRIFHPLFPNARTHTQGLTTELNTQVQNASLGLGKHSARAVWVPRHLRLISCQNKGVPQFPWAAGHECEDSCTSEGEEVISSSRCSSHLTHQQCFTRQAVSATSPTQSLSAVPSPAAPRGCALPAPCGFCLLLPSGLLGHPHSLCSPVCVYHISFPREPKARGQCASFHTLCEHWDIPINRYTYIFLFHKRKFSEYYLMLSNTAISFSFTAA